MAAGPREPVPQLPPAGRLPVLALGMLCLLLGVLAGLFRMGWAMPAIAAEAAALHGPLMVSGFFGTVISLERAVALRAPGWTLAPLAAGVGGLLTATGAAGRLGPALIAAASIVLLTGSLRIYYRQRAMFTLTLALGAACWLAGNLLWLLGGTVFGAAPFWIGFLVLTIAGERLELSRVLPPSAPARGVFGAIVGALLLGMSGAVAGTPIILSAALLALALWLLRQDVARRNLRQRGITRFIAVCLLSGYAWLAIGALVSLAHGGLGPATAGWTSALHAILLGFVFSMVFGHAPIIFPAVIAVRMPYHPYFYAPLAVLHATLALRIAGALLELPGLRAAGGMGNAVALLLFVIGVIAAVVRGRQAAAATRT